MEDIEVEIEQQAVEVLEDAKPDPRLGCEHYKRKCQLVVT